MGWGALLLGLVFVWISMRVVSAQAPGRTVGQSATTAAAKPSIESSARPGNGINQSQEEAARLKRESVDAARQLAEAYPQDAFTYALLGSAYYNTGRSEEAIKNLRKCLELNPNQADAYEILARIAYEKGQLDETIRLCQEAIKRGSPNPEVLNQWGRALLDQGRTEDAIQTFQKAVRLPQPMSESSYLLGQAFLQSGNYAQAKESFQGAIALLPDHTQAFFGLFTACTRLGQMEEAGRYREQFQKLEATDRRSLTDRSAQEDTLTGLPMVHKTVARTFFGAGQIYQAHEQFDKAAELLIRSATLDEENTYYRAALEAHYVQRKALAAGVAAFKQLLAMQPNNPLNHLYLGRVHVRLEQFELAETAYLKVQELAPQWSEGYRLAAELYLRSNRKLADAQAFARRAVELKPSGPHYYLLAFTCAKNGDRPGAIAAAKQAVALSPGEKRYQDLLQQLNKAP